MLNDSVRLILVPSLGQLGVRESPGTGIQKKWGRT